MESPGGGPATLGPLTEGLQDDDFVVVTRHVRARTDEIDRLSQTLRKRDQEHRHRLAEKQLEASLAQKQHEQNRAFVLERRKLLHEQRLDVAQVRLTYAALVTSVLVFASTVALIAWRPDCATVIGLALGPMFIWLWRWSRLSVRGPRVPDSQVSWTLWRRVFRRATKQSPPAPPPP